MASTRLKIIGANTFISLEGIKNIPAKIDTGADSSAVHADNIVMSKDGILSFEIFGKKIQTKEFTVVTIRSSNGEEQIRYRVPLLVTIGDKKMISNFALSNRNKNHFPVLIGRKTIKNHFIVDVSKAEVDLKKKKSAKSLNKEMQKNPFQFHKKYIRLNHED